MSSHSSISDVDSIRDSTEGSSSVDIQEVSEEKSTCDTIPTVKSIWSSNTCESSTDSCEEVLPSDAPIFVREEGLITYNFSRGISPKASLIVGDYPKAKDIKNILEVTGDAGISGNLSVKGTIFADSVVSPSLVQKTQYVEGMKESTSNFTVVPEDGISCIYANPTQGDVYINLGSLESKLFREGRVITIKDVSLEFSSGSSNNVYIWAPSGVRIETYDNGTGGFGLVSKEGGGYILNTSGGSATFRYFVPKFLGSLPAWVIENQFMGNGRILPSSGLVFVSATDSMKTNMFKRK